MALTIFRKNDGVTADNKAFEEAYYEHDIALSDLRSEPEENRILLRVRDQREFFQLGLNEGSSDGQLFAALPDLSEFLDSITQLEYSLVLVSFIHE